MDTIEPRLDKSDINKLNLPQKRALGKEIEKMMANEKAKLS